MVRKRERRCDIMRARWHDRVDIIAGDAVVIDAEIPFDRSGIDQGLRLSSRSVHRSHIAHDRAPQPRTRYHDGRRSSSDQPASATPPSACSAEVESGSPTRTCAKGESTAFSVHMGSPSDPIWTENTVVAPIPDRHSTDVQWWDRLPATRPAAMRVDASPGKTPATVRTPTTKGFARWSDRHACGTQPNVINCMVSCPVSPFAQRVLVPLLGAITGGAWHLGRGSVTTEVKLCSNRKASRSTRSTFP